MEGKRVICGRTSPKKLSTPWALARNPRQVRSEDSVHLGGNIEGGLIALGFVFGAGSLRALLVGIETREHRLNVLVASGNQVLKMPVACQSLLQAKGGLAFSQEDGINNGQPADPGNVADDIVELEIHLGEGVLHEKHLRGGALEQGGAMAQDAANRANGLRRPERASQ